MLSSASLSALSNSHTAVVGTSYEKSERSNPTQSSLIARLDALLQEPENQTCCDCAEGEPKWASIILSLPGAPFDIKAIGAFCCFQCSRAHRSLGDKICDDRSIYQDEWTEKEVKAMELGGNARVNSVFGTQKFVSGCSSELERCLSIVDYSARKKFIEDKYKHRKFYDASKFLNSNFTTNGVVGAAQQQQILLKLKEPTSEESMLWLMQNFPTLTKLPNLAITGMEGNPEGRPRGGSASVAPTNGSKKSKKKKNGKKEKKSSGDKTKKRGGGQQLSKSMSSSNLQAGLTEEEPASFSCDRSVGNMSMNSCPTLLPRHKRASGDSGPIPDLIISTSPRKKKSSTGSKKKSKKKETSKDQKPTGRGVRKSKSGSLLDMQNHVATQPTMAPLGSNHNIGNQTQASSREHPAHKKAPRRASAPGLGSTSPMPSPDENSFGSHGSDRKNGSLNQDGEQAKRRIYVELRLPHSNQLLDLAPSAPLSTWDTGSRISATSTPQQTFHQWQQTQRSAIPSSALSNPLLQPPPSFAGADSCDDDTEAEEDSPPVLKVDHGSQEVKPSPRRKTSLTPSTSDPRLPLKKSSSSCSLGSLSGITKKTRGNRKTSESIRSKTKKTSSSQNSSRKAKDSNSKPTSNRSGKSSKRVFPDNGSISSVSTSSRSSRKPQLDQFKVKSVGTILIGGQATPITFPEGCGVVQNLEVVTNRQAQLDAMKSPNGKSKQKNRVEPKKSTSKPVSESSKDEIKKKKKKKSTTNASESTGKSSKGRDSSKRSSSSKTKDKVAKTPKSSKRNSATIATHFDSPPRLPLSRLQDEEDNANKDIAVRASNSAPDIGHNPEPLLLSPNARNNPLLGQGVGLKGLFQDNIRRIMEKQQLEEEEKKRDSLRAFMERQLLESEDDDDDDSEEEDDDDDDDEEQPADKSAPRIKRQNSMPKLIGRFDENASVPSQASDIISMEQSTIAERRTRVASSNMPKSRNVGDLDKFMTSRKPARSASFTGPFNETSMKKTTMNQKGSNPSSYEGAGDDDSCPPSIKSISSCEMDSTGMNS